jgi:2-C-methyl-D-erythritol 4-phosphate cytidylyltransferase
MRELAACLAPTRTIRVVEGGAMRQDSVRYGLQVVPERCGAVLVHDGARPMIDPADVRAAMIEVRDGRASLLAVRVVDTIKVVDPASSIVIDTPPRETLWSAQTPQCAVTSDLRRAHARGESDGIRTTDDAALLERIGIEVVVVPAVHSNFKVTVPEDIERAHALLSDRASTTVLEA